MEAPAPALTTKDRIQKCKAVFVDNQYGQSLPTSAEMPCGAITANPKQNLVSAVWIDKRYGSGLHNHQSTDESCGALVANPKESLMTARFILNHTFDNTGTSVNSPAPTILASRKHHYLVNAQWGVSAGRSIERPCMTVIARQDKAPISLATCAELTGVQRVIIRETNNPDARPVHIFPNGTVVYNLPGEILLRNGAAQKRTVRSKKGKVTCKFIQRTAEYYHAIRELLELMAEYGIVDIKMRMLNVTELLRIQGFPEDYHLVGSQSDKKKFIGNAVYTGIPKNWGEVAYHELNAA